jgi:hypothetical protein
VSLTFSDPGLPSAPGRYRRGLVATVLVLTLVIIAALAFTLSDGPRLRSVSVDESSAVQAPGAVVALRSDRALKPVDEGAIVVTPSAPFSVETTDVDVRIVFTYPLLASTTYRIAVDGVSPRGWGAQSSWEASFTTPSLDFLYLRSAGADDELMRYSLDGSGPEVLYRAPGIISFTRVGVVYAVLRTVDNETFLELVEPETGAVDRIPNTPGLTLVDMARSAWGTSLVMTVDAQGQGIPRGTQVLALVDTLGARTPEIVLGPDGAPLGVLKVAVSDISGNIVVWLRDQSLVRFDPLTGVVLPVGVATELWGFDATGHSVIYVDALGTVMRNLRTTEESRIVAGTLEGFPVFHEFTVATPNGNSIQRVRVPGIDDGPPFSVVTLDEGEGEHLRLMGSLRSPQSIGSIGLSPNGHYLIVEIHDLTSPLGFVGLGPDVIRTGTRLVIYDLAAGVIYAQEPGYAFTW